MAQTKVTGRTEEGIEELRQEYRQKHEREPDVPFERAYCLAKIPNQPEEYTGPDRFCTLNYHLSQIGGSVRCKYHGGEGSLNEENLDTLGNMKHGMHATQQHLAEDFDEKDQALYDWIMTQWPDAYGIEFSEDPAAKHDMHRLAVEVVRAERGRGYLISEGEVKEQEVVGENGLVIDPESGEVMTEESEHYLAQMLHRQDKKITQLEKELGITRKERLKQDSTDSAVEAIQGFAELGAAFLDRDDQDYDPDEEPWDD